MNWKGDFEMHNGATSTPMILQGIDHVLESNGKPFMKLKDQKVDQWHSLFWKYKLKWANTFFRTAQSRGTRSHPLQQKLRHVLKTVTCLHVERETLPKHRGEGRVRLTHLDKTKCVQAYILTSLACSEFDTGRHFLKCLDNKLRVRHWPGADI